MNAATCASRSWRPRAASSGPAALLKNMMRVAAIGAMNMKASWAAGTAELGGGHGRVDFSFGLPGFQPRGKRADGDVDTTQNCAPRVGFASKRIAQEDREQLACSRCAPRFDDGA